VEKFSRVRHSLLGHQCQLKLQKNPKKYLEYNWWWVVDHFFFHENSDKKNTKQNKKK
jgi:hypothetical protein